MPCGCIWMDNPLLPCPVQTVRGGRRQPADCNRRPAVSGNRSQTVNCITQSFSLSAPAS